MRHRLLAVSVSFVAIAGCSLLTDLPSLSSGGPLVDGGATIDGDGSKVDGGRSEAGAEGGSGDGGVPDASGCARYPSATFCVDFDGTNPLTPPTWTENDALKSSPPGTIALTTSDPISAPNAAHFEIGMSSNNCRYLRLSKNLSGTFSNVVSRFAMRAEDPGVFYSLAVTVDPNLSFSILIALGVDKSVHFFVQQNINNNVTEIGSDDANLDVPWPGRWIDLTLEYKSSPTKSVSLTIPGARTLVVPLPGTFVAVDPELGIGPYCTGDLTRLTFDDFATWVTP